MLTITYNQETAQATILLPSTDDDVVKAVTLEITDENVTMVFATTGKLVSIYLKEADSYSFDEIVKIVEALTAKYKLSFNAAPSNEEIPF